MVVDAERRGGVALRVEVDDQDPGTVQGEGRGKVDRRGRLAHAALLIGDHHHASLRRAGKSLTGTTQGLYCQLGSTTNGGVVHRGRCFT